MFGKDTCAKLDVLDLRGGRKTSISTHMHTEQVTYIFKRTNTQKQAPRQKSIEIIAQEHSELYTEFELYSKPVLKQNKNENKKLFS